MPVVLSGGSVDMQCMRDSLTPNAALRSFRWHPTLWHPTSGEATTVISDFVLGVVVKPLLITGLMVSLLGGLEAIARSL
jgi:hypothetical protein